MASYKQFYEYVLRKNSFISSLPIAGYCQSSPRKSNILQTYQESILLIKKFMQDTIAFVDKIIPHSLYDMMIMSIDETPVKSAITDLQKGTVDEILTMSYKFLEFVSQNEAITRFGLNNGRFHLCFNYDPDTLDRESGMFEKRFHLHLNYWTKAELDYSLVKKMDELHFSEMRKLIDPMTIIAEYVLNDILQSNKLIGELLPVNFRRDVAQGLPSGVKIKYPGWHVLLNRNFSDEIRLLHTIINEAYLKISSCFFEDNQYIVEPWKRNKLKKSNEIIQELKKFTFLSSESLHYLTLLSELLRDIPLNIMERLKTDKEKRIQMLSMGGLNYSLGMYTPLCNMQKQPIINAQPVILVIQAKLFGAVGGAGITYMGDIPVVRLHRNAREYTVQEAALRREFHENCLNAITKK